MRVQTQFLLINIIGGIAVLGGDVIALINNPETNEFGVCVSCDPENNVIKRRSLPRMQNNISLINQYEHKKYL